MDWIEQEKYVEGNYGDFEYREKVAGFDLDGTLIQVKSGGKFPKDDDDWVMHDKIVKKIKKLYEDEYCVIIISNQAGITSGQQNKGQWLSKIKKIADKLLVPFKIFASISKDTYRKPFMTFWRMVEEEINIDKTESFFGGDACGRPGDHSDVDLKFALNNGITFYTPEELFGINKCNPKFTGKKLKEDFLKNHPHIVKTDGPPKFTIFYPNDNTQKFDLNDTNVKILVLDYFKNKKDNSPILFIAVGFPASGKSSFVQRYLEPFAIRRINMDTLKTKAKCISECKKFIKDKNNIVVDNTNIDIESRSIYMGMAKNAGYKIVCVETDYRHKIDVWYHNSLYRAFKTQNKPIPKLVYNVMNKKYIRPSYEEKFDLMIMIDYSTPDDSDYYKYYLEK